MLTEPWLASGDGKRRGMRMERQIKYTSSWFVAKKKWEEYKEIPNHQTIGRNTCIKLDLLVNFGGKWWNKEK